MEGPRVAYVSRKHPPSVGGMQKLSQRLLRELRRRCDVVPIVYDCPRSLLAPFLLWAAVRLLFELAVARRRVHVVHFGDPLLAILSPLCAARGVPTVVTVHGLDVTYRNWLYQRLLGASLRYVDRFACISTAAKQACIKRGIAPERCVVITPGVDPPQPPISAEPRRHLRERVGLELGASTVLLTVGRLVRRKGVGWFVEAVLPGLVRRDPSVRYLVVGDGPEFPTVRGKAAKLGLESHVFLTGRVDDDVLQLCFAAADIFVMPNVPVDADMEGFGLVALEAAAAGLPVVAADLEGIRDAITPGENGVLVPACDAEAFAKAVVSLAKDHDRRKAFGQRAAAYTLATHSWRGMADAYSTLYQAISGAPCDSGAAERPASGSGWEAAYRRTRRSLIKRCRRIKVFNLPTTSRILDYGCGDGLDLRCFRKLGYQRVAGLDRSEALLRAGCDGAPVVVADALKTPFADCSFDVVYVNSVLHHLDFDKALGEVRRVLRPGGLLCLIEQRSGWPRRILDVVTFSRLGRLIPIAGICHRRAALLHEIGEYTGWLKRSAVLADDLRLHGFEVLMQRNTLFSVLLACRRLDDVPGLPCPSDDVYH